MRCDTPPRTKRWQDAHASVRVAARELLYRIMVTDPTILLREIFYDISYIRSGSSPAEEAARRSSGLARVREGAPTADRTGCGIQALIRAVPLTGPCPLRPAAGAGDVV